MSCVIVVLPNTLAGELLLREERLHGQHESKSFELGFLKDLTGLHDNNHIRLVVQICSITSVLAAEKENTMRAHVPSYLNCTFKFGRLSVDLSAVGRVLSECRNCCSRFSMLHLSTSDGLIPLPALLPSDVNSTQGVGVGGGGSVKHSRGWG